MITSKEKLRHLEELNNETCENISVYQNICIDELCEKYAENYEELGVENKNDLLNFLKLLANDIHKIYFD